MNWQQLRPILRERYGDTFSFYNDKYRSGKRRIKIGYTYDAKDMLKFIIRLDSTIKVKRHDYHTITIHFDEN